MAIRITALLGFLCSFLLATPAPAQQPLISERLKPDEGIKQLVAGLSDGDVEVRRESVRKLVDLGPAAMPAWIPLSAALLDDDATVRERAILALDRIGPRSYSIAGAALRTVLRRNAKSPDVQLATRTFLDWHSDLTLLYRQIPYGTDTLNTYLEVKGDVDQLRTFRRNDWPVREFPPNYPQEIEAVEKSDFSERDVAQYLRRFAGNGYHWTGKWLSQARLARRGKVPTPPVDELIASLARGKRNVRNAQALLQLVPFAYAETPREQKERVWKVANDLLATTLDDMRLQAKVFWSLDGRSPPREFDVGILDGALIQQMIIPALTHPSERVRGMAVRSMTDLSADLPAKDHDAIWKAVKRLQPDVRDEIVQTIGRTSLSHPLLRTILRNTADTDSEPSIRLAALQFLNEVGNESNGLLALVSDQTLELNLRITALHVLRKRAVKDGLKMLDQLDELEQRLINAHALIELDSLVRKQQEVNSAIRSRARRQVLDLADKPSPQP
ncbi:MAG: HEAT repeat domain-containing protein [Planctomycetaceae bacterium]|nr:HEAT repeat domain-containing protein [Planctomycetaceae bacterium]